MNRLWIPHDRPSGCEGCPRNDVTASTGFVPGHGAFDAALIVIGEQPGGDEVAEGRPFVGKSGRELTAGLGSIGRDGVFITNVRKCLGEKGETADVKRRSIAHCVEAYLQEELNRCKSAKTILCIGADALDVVVGVQSAIKWHGSVLARAEVDGIRETRHAET
jgi:uracil-DNA glycosylase